MSDIIELPFLTPTDQDKFVEKEISKNVFVIEYENETLKAKFSKEAKGPVMELITFPAHYDDKMKKLIGYALFKILPRYQPTTTTSTGYEKS